MGSNQVAEGFLVGLVHFHQEEVFGVGILENLERKGFGAGHIAGRGCLVLVCRGKGEYFVVVQPHRRAESVRVAGNTAGINAITGRNGYV